MQRMGMVIGLKPQKVDADKALHATPWPEMDAALKATHIGNYSIYLRQPENLNDRQADCCLHRHRLESGRRSEVGVVL